jgi:hypothetical protein
MSKRLTHQGELVVPRAGPGDLPRYTVLLRETAQFWVTSSGAKYRKADGRATKYTGANFLDLASIKPWFSRQDGST